MYLLYTTDGDHFYIHSTIGHQMSSSLTLNGTSDRTNQTTYDFLGRATQIKQTGNAVDEIFADFEHNANGLLTSVNRYEVDDNDVVTSVANSLYTYNAANAITSITHKKPDETPIVQHSYTYDETNNIISYLNSLDGSTSYDYDFLGQLTGTSSTNTATPDETYTYDSNGNRLTANGEDYTTGTNNELTSDSTYTYTYDSEGNRISKTNSTNRELYEWDYRNRLTKVTQQEYNSTTEEWQDVQIVEYTYDFNNIWIRKTVGTNSTIFIPENYQTTVQIDNNTITHHYLWTPQYQDKLLADTTTDGILWSLTDHLGTIRDIIGTTNTHLIYDAFGNLISGTNPILFGYTGKAFDTSTQLQNNINRWYDASIGRWLSTDPIGFYGNDTNLYRYSLNRVLIASDIWGLQIGGMGWLPTPGDAISSAIHNQDPGAINVVIKSTVEGLQTIKEDTPMSVNNITIHNELGVIPYPFRALYFEIIEESYCEENYPTISLSLRNTEWKSIHNDQGVSLIIGKLDVSTNLVTIATSKVTFKPCPNGEGGIAVATMKIDVYEETAVGAGASAKIGSPIPVGLGIKINKSRIFLWSFTFGPYNKECCAPCES